MTPELTTHVLTAADGTVCLTIAGDLDFNTAPVLRTAVGQIPLPPGTLLVLDLTALGFCDSSGLTALLAARRHADASGSALALAGVPANVLRIFQLTGLEGLFDLYPAPAGPLSAHRPG